MLESPPEEVPKVTFKRGVQMLKVSVLASILLAITASNLEAQGRVVGRAFLNAPVGSAEEYASIIERCGEPQARLLNISCEELVRSFNEAFDDVDDVADFKELAAYIRTLAFRPCPQAGVDIARVVNGKVDYFNRMLRFGEMCFVDLNLNRYISSAICGQWIRTKLGLIYTGLGDKLTPASDTELSTGPPANSLDAAGLEELKKKLAEQQAKLDLLENQSRTTETPAAPSRKSWMGRYKWPLGIAVVALGAGACVMWCRPVDVTIRTDQTIRP